MRLRSRRTPSPSARSSVTTAAVYVSPVYRVFKVGELLAHILHFLPRPHLVSCALVCRDWELPSLRLIWKELKWTDVQHLFHLLGPRQEPLGYVEEETWARFRRYASLVRLLGICVQETLGTSPAVIQGQLVNDALFAAQSRGTQLLPFLNHLTIQPQDGESAKTVVGFINPTLRYLRLDWLDLSGDSNTQMMLSALSRVQHCASSLTRLRVQLRPDSDAVISPLAKTIGSLHELKNLEIPSNLQLHPNVWTTCGQLTSLHVIKSVYPITMDVMLARESFIAQPPSLAGHFESLRDFFCTMPTQTALHIFSLPTTTTLNFLVLVILGGPDVEGIRGVIATICRNVPNLRFLNVAFIGSFDPPSIRDFTPRTQFKGVTKIRIYTDLAASLTDNDFKELAKGLRKLYVLVISPLPISSEAPPPATILSLSHIARYCRRITAVGLYLDTSRDRLPVVEDDLGIFSRTLETLNFGLSDVSDAVSVALPIVRMTPHCAPVIQCTPMLGSPKRDGLPRSIVARMDRVAEKWVAVSATVAQVRPYVNRAA